MPLRSVLASVRSGLSFILLFLLLFSAIAAFFSICGLEIYL